ncbi:hypothetical protein BGZ58_002956 [Dissophora ornata]|nr:hypothetical protein BGZ58_002956 [Dissophora ornata]
MVDGDEEDDDNSIFEDPHYTLNSNVNGIKASAPIRAIDIRSGLQMIDLPSDLVSSQDSSILGPETGAEILKGALEALDRAREQILRQQMSVVYVDDSDARHYAALLRDQLDVLSDSMLLATTPYSPDAEDTMHTNDTIDSNDTFDTFDTFGRDANERFRHPRYKGRSFPYNENVLNQENCVR